MRKLSLKKPKFFKGLNAPYRMVFINDESLEEVATFRMTKSSVYTLFSTLFVVTIAATVLLLVFTPMRYYIPGYGSSADRTQVLRLRTEVDSLSRLAQSQQAQADNIHRILAGKEIPLDTTMLDPDIVEREAKASILPDPEEVQKEAAQAVKQQQKSTGKR